MPYGRKEGEHMNKGTHKDNPSDDTGMTDEEMLREDLGDTSQKEEAPED